MDRKDLELLVDLSSHGRWGAQALSSIISLTPENIERRIRLMIREGVIQGFSAFFDRRMFGYDTTFLKVHFDTRMMDRVVKTIASMPQVASIQPNMDDFLICEVVHWDRRSLESAIRSIGRQIAPFTITAYYEPRYPEMVPERPRGKELKILCALVEDGRAPVTCLSETADVPEDGVEIMIMDMEKRGVLRICPLIQEGLIDPFPPVSLIVSLGGIADCEGTLSKVLGISKMVWYSKVLEKPPGIWLKAFGEDLHAMDDMIERIRRQEGVSDLTVIFAERVVYNRRVDRAIVKRAMGRSGKR